MEYIYAGMLLYKAGKEINEANVKKVLEAAGVKVDEGRVKALVAALDGVDIDKEIKEASVMSGSVSASVKENKEVKEDKKVEKKDDKEAAAGLGALFG